MKEKMVEGAVCKYAKELGFLHRKYTSPSVVSVPDRILWGHGVCFLIEFKRFGEKPRPSQVREIKRIRDHGGLVAVIDNIPDGRHLLECFVNGRITKEAGEMLHAV